MPMTCTICRHKEREEIEQDLIKGVSLRNIAKRYNVGYSAVNRHKEHIPAHLAQAAKGQEKERARDLLQEVEELQQTTYNLLKKAEAAGDLRTALYGASQARGNMELLCKMVAYLREQQLDELSRKRQQDFQEVSPFIDDPVFMTALQRAIDETEAYYEQTGQLPDPGRS